ncbi:type VII secretion protein EssC [Listeria costaricensis]|uniref:type VII secretion protein EssC n=1 Tax=Listeria costaricensis TaxID=2026604 RepID=UPI000C08A4B2|nr:type VII secretion protein EssC [Listeria costaricensis]
MGKSAFLIVTNGETCHKQHLQRNDRRFTIGSRLEDTVTYPQMAETLEVAWQDDNWFAGSTALSLDSLTEIETDDTKLGFYLAQDLKSRSYDVSDKLVVTFGAGADRDIILQDTKASMSFLRDDRQCFFEAHIESGEVYHNFARVQGAIRLEAGDQLYTDGVTIQVGLSDLTISAADSRVTSRLAPLFAADNAYSEDYPDYHRSPRIIYRAPEEKMTIAKPSAAPSKPTEGLIKIILPPLVMIALTVIISIFQPRGIYIIMTLAMTGMTVIMSLTNFIKNSKKYKVDVKEREESYDRYLKMKTKELHEASLEQRHALTYHYPSIEEIRAMATSVDSRIYEKTMFHHDFLTFRVGCGEEKSSFPIDFREEEFTQEKDALIEEAKTLKSQYLRVQNVPVATDLMHGPVGYIGPRRLVLEQLQMMVMQTALFHSYYDLQFITIFPEEEKADWEWMRWLPHADLRDVNVRGFVYHERSRDQVLNSLYQILKERKQTLSEHTNKTEQLYFTPRYVVLVTDEKMILDHTVMEFFNEDPSDLGVSLIFVQDVMQSLPEHVKTVVDIRDAQNGNILLENGELVNRHFVPDHFPADFDKEEVSRALAPLNHLQNLKNSIPESVTFLEMYGVEKVEELNIAGRWAKNETYKSLAVPLGLRGKDDLVQLNLHEKAHGPHGLVAGTTGSGKSEIIQSYIISLAVNFHPYEVAFLLIDYKGGGMANLFKNMPHLLGTITNLDGAQSMRALASIKAELQKRQRLFGEHDVNHINQYQKLYKQGKASEPMPHLFLISDEFAELKSEQPEFMKELVSTARIGRSLGIHLILATQKPSGVVDDQIWSNSKFKLALKVQNASDSNEMLKTPDAADITLPGRAYLQVGNNEIYELFQSAWSGADYVPDKEDTEYIDTTIYAINELGQYDILTEDLSGLDKKDDLTKLPSELDAVIDHIHEYTEQQGIEALPRPWLPPLEERIYLPELHPVNYTEAWEGEKKPLETSFGFLDIPQMQQQEPIKLNLTKDGHMIVFSSPGYGKSTFLQTVTMDLARQHNPKRLHVYLLDLGTNGLLPLKSLPHVADTIMVDEEIKLGKLMRRLAQELKERKRLLSQYGVANMTMYEKASGKEVPSILLVVDAYDSVAEAPFKEPFEKLIAQIAREGAGVGIHLIISAVRQNALRVQVLANIKHQIALYLLEAGEARSIVGKTNLTIEELPGRGLIKIDEPLSFQTALPVNGEETLAIIEGVQSESEAMHNNWQGELPEPIPMVPEVLSMEDFKKKKKTIEMLKEGKTPFAVDFEEVEPIELDVKSDGTTLVLADNRDILERTTVALFELAISNQEIDIILLDNSTGRFQAYKQNANIYAGDGEAMNLVADQILQLFEAREDTWKKLQQEGDGAVTLKMYMEELRPTYVFITEASYATEQIDPANQKKMAKIIEQGARMGIYVIGSGVSGILSRGLDDISAHLKKQKVGIIVGRISDQNVLSPIQSVYREQPLAPYEAYYMKNGQYQKIKLTAPMM